MKFSGAGIGLKSVVYHMKPRRLCLLRVSACPQLPSNGFRFKGFYSPAIAFSCSATMFGISCERKAPISDCGAFSDERAREGFALGCRLCLHLLPGIGFACGFMLCFGRFVSFQIRLQSHTSQKACGVSSAFPGLLSCYCPPGLVFVFNAVSCLSDAFSFRKRCSICPRERKWLINDSCAFSDERPGRLCFRSITQESALLWSCRVVSDIYRGETARHGFRGAGFASGFKSCRAVPDI